VLLLVLLGHFIAIRTFLLCSICVWHITYILDGSGSDSESIVNVMLG